jgi:hypothetical protein
MNPLVSAKVVGDNIPLADYVGQLPNVNRGDPEYVLSRSDLVEIGRCAHRWVAGYQPPDSDAKEWGALIDCMTLSPDRFRTAYAMTPEMYPDSKTGEPKPWNWNANYCKAWRDERPGVTIIRPNEFEEASAAVSVLMADEQIRDLIKLSRKQVMVVAEYKDADTDLTVPLKCLIDLVSGIGLADLKTCSTASPFVWPRDVFNYGYNVQAALYLDAYNLATGENRQEFVHILQESFAPWETAKRMLSAEFIELGRASYIAALKRYCGCLKENRWPGYDEGARLVVNGLRIVEPEAYMIGRSE